MGRGVRWRLGEQLPGSPWWPGWVLAIGVEKVGCMQKVFSTEGRI